MSIYTQTLNELINTGFDIGLKEYPIFDEAYRGALNAKIKRHFLFREIGLETAEEFKHYLNMKMDEIMPLYNQLYESESLIVNPLVSFDVTETNTKQVDGTVNAVADQCNTTTNENISTVETTGTDTSTVNSTGTGTNVTHTDMDNVGHTENVNSETLLSVHSDTPQALLSQANIQGNNYASAADRAANSITSNGDTTSVTESDSTGSNTNELATNSNSTTAAASDSKNSDTGTATIHGTNLNTITNLETYTNYRHGHLGNKNYSEMLLDFRATFLNIDLMIIKDLSACFMGVY